MIAPSRRGGRPARALVAAALVAAPIVLFGWIAWKGRGPPRQPRSASRAEAARVPPGDDAALRQLFDGLAPAAQLKAPVVLYDAQKLYEYIDGGAPLYLARHFRRLAAAELATPGGAELNADVYDMAAPENAAAMFEAEASPRSTPVEGFDAARAGAMSLVFREGRFYVKLTAFDARGEAALPAVGRTLAGRMR